MADATKTSASTAAAGLAWTFFERLNDGDVDGAFALMADDGTFWSNGARAAAPGAVAMPVLRHILEYVPVQMTLTRAIRDGNVVALECQGSGLTRDDTRYDNVYVFVVEERAGSILSVREYADTLYAQRVLPAAVLTAAVSQLGAAGRGAR